MRSAADMLLTSGYARITLNPADGAALTTVLRECRSFFSRPTEQKQRHASADGNSGYRSMGLEYSAFPDRPDVNEVMSLWSDRIDLIPEADRLGPLTDALVGWRTVMVRVVHELLEEISGRFSAAAPAFAKASQIQVNHYFRAPPARIHLQDRHEDGNIATVMHGTAPGLEIVRGDDEQSIETSPGEIFVLPGATLTDLTGGAVAALDHQVRNLGISDRQSIMYFVNPELAHPVYPWVGDAAARAVDLRDVVRNRPSAYGLPAVPEL